MNDWQKFLRRFHHPRSLSPKTRRLRRSPLSLEMLEERCTPATFFVNVNGGNDNNAGTSPGAAFASIQAAVNAAKNLALNGQDGNTIDVATGTYTNSGQPNSAVSVGFPSVVGITDQSLNIVGGFSSDFTSDTGTSTIDGSSQIRGVAAVSTSRPTGVNLSNFVIQNCVGPQSTISTTVLDGFGGGMIIVVGSTTGNPTDTISNVTFTNDVAQGSNNANAAVNSGSGGEGAGGGLAAFANDNVQLSNVTFDGDSARGGTGVVRGGSGLGGAIFMGNAGSITGNNVTFTNNAAVGGNSAGAGVVSPNTFEEGFGGAVALFNQGTSGTFTNVTATGNLAQGGNSGGVAGDARGGVFYSENATLSLTNSLLMNNTAQGGNAPNGADASVGGAIYLTTFTNGATDTINQDSIINNTVVGPTVTGTPTQVLGGGIGSDAGSGQSLTLNITNTVIAGNSLTTPSPVVINGGGGGIWTGAVTLNLLQSTVADNTLGASNMTGSSLLTFGGIDNLAFNIIADESGTQPAIASFQGGTVNLTGVNLFANIQTIGLSLPSGQLTAASADFTNAAGRDYTLQSNSPAINAATGSSVTVDRLGNRRVGTPDLGAFEFGGLPPSDFISELGAYRPSNGSWSLDSDGTLGFNSATDQVFFDFSPGGVTGVAGDWNGTGISSVGDFENGTWHLDLNDNGVLDAGETFQFGQAGDQPVVGDWNGQGKDELGVFRAAPDGITGEFILDVANHKTMDSSNLVFTFGLATDRILVGDWTGDGISKVGVFRNASSFIPADAGDAVFSLDTNNNHTFDSGDQVFVFGLITDGIVIGDWNGSGTSKVGVYRPATAFGAPNTAVFSLDTNGQLQFNASSEVFLYGVTTDQFVTGHWAKTPPLQPEGTPQAEFAANGVGPGAAPLTEGQLAPVVQQAIAYWAAQGANVAQLEAVPVQIGSLDGNLVGWTDADGITISTDAAGWGWYTGSSPNVPANQMDLLTVVEHEFGHEVGLSDVDTATHPGNIMDATLPTGVRRS